MGKLSVCSGVILIVISTLLLARDYDSASFNCSRATTKVEKLICDNPDLSNVDKRLGEVYARMQKSLSKSEVNQLKKAQREWLKQRDEKLLECGTEIDCAVQIYESRIAELESSPKPSMSAKSASSPKSSSDDKVYGEVITESTDLNVRQGMGTDTPIVGKAKKGAKIRIVETLGTWYKVQLETGKVGYVSSEFLKLLDQDTSNSTTSATEGDSDSAGLLSASFNCAKAASPAEKLICGNPQLSDADGRLGDLYANLQKSLSASDFERLKEEQKTWLKQRDKKLLACDKDTDCAVQVYEDRMTELSAYTH